MDEAPLNSTGHAKFQISQGLKNYLMFHSKDANGC